MSATDRRRSTISCASNGGRAVLMTILKAGSASTIQIVDNAKALLPLPCARLCPTPLKVQPLADQSLFVKAAVSGVVARA
jgi:multidrug efflux pump subunit AcrB